MIEFLIKFFIILAIMIIYFRFILDKLGPISRPLVSILRLGKRYPSRDVSAIINLPLTGISLALFGYVMLLITGVKFGQLVVGEFKPIFILYGILLGIGDMALSSLFCNLGIQIVTKLDPKGSPPHLDDWLVIAKGGWMHYYLRTIEIAPLPLAVLSILFYISIEEIIFRGIIITYFLNLGTLYALWGSVFIFTFIQIFHTPNWLTAMFPVLGALVIGILHGILFIAVPNIIPLIIAHFVFFLVAVI